MENEEVKVIPWIAHEAEVARMERVNKRMFLLCIIIFVALVVTNGGWIWFESQYEDIVLNQEAETDSGVVNVNGIGVGDMYIPDASITPGAISKDGVPEHE